VSNCTTSTHDESSFEQANRNALTSCGESLWDVSQKSKILLIFVRHAGCTFCRETLSELKRELPALQKISIIPVVVHMGSVQQGQAMLERAGLRDTLQISDPGRSLYRAYELNRGRLTQLLGPSVLWKGFLSAILKGHGFGRWVGDGFQLGGAFLIQSGRILASFPAKNAADKVPFECILESSP
jgi:peroxiredoxin